MRVAASSLLALLAAPVQAQQVAGCGTAPPLTALIEPWEETTVLLGDGAVRLALLEEEGGQGLLVLTLPTIEEVDAAEGETEPGAPPPLPERRCRIVTEGGIGFALIDVAAVEVVEDAGAGTLVARLPSLRFVPESSELEEVTLVLTLGLGDGSLLAEVEAAAADEEVAPATTEDAGDETELDESEAGPPADVP